MIHTSINKHLQKILKVIQNQCIHQYDNVMTSSALETKNCTIKAIIRNNTKTIVL